MLFAFVHVPVHLPRIDEILPLVPPDPTALLRTTGISAVARKAISPGSRTLYASNMPVPRVRATMFTRQGRRTDPHGHSHSVELHEAASPYRHPRYDWPSAKEKLIPLVPSATSGPQPAGWCSCKGSIPVDCEACDRALTPGQRCQGHVYRRGERDESEVVLVHTRQRTDD